MTASVPSRGSWRTGAAKILLVCTPFAMTTLHAAQKPVPAKAPVKLDYLLPRIPPYRSEGPAVPPRFLLEARPPVTPDRLEAYEVLPSTVDAAFVQRIAASFDLKAVPRGPDGDRWELTESGEDPSRRRTLTVYVASGAFSYAVEDLLFARADQQPRLPSEKEAHELAVRSLKERGLLPSDALIDLQQVHFSRPTLIERSVKEKKNLKEIVTSIEVRFPRALDGYRVRGPGAKLYVAIGEGGKVLGVSKVWRDVTKTGTRLPSIQPEDAIQLLQQGAGVLDADPLCEQAQVLRMEVLYWMDGPKAPQRNVLPVYRVEGRCLSADRKALRDFQAYAPAVLNAPFGGGRGERQP